MFTNPIASLSVLTTLQGADADQNVAPSASSDFMNAGANELSKASKEIAMSPASADAQQRDEHITSDNDKPPVVDQQVSSHEQRPVQCILQTAVPEDHRVSFREQSQDRNNELGSQPQPEETVHDTPKSLCDIAPSNEYINLDSTKDVDPPTQSTTTSQASLSDVPSPLVTQPTVPKTPQEITLAELKAQKVALLASLAAVPAVQVLIEENASSNADTADEEPTEAEIMAVANKMVKDHIKLLHEYNELKDVGQGLMGLIADQRGVRIVEVNEEFGIDVND